MVYSDNNCTIVPLYSVYVHWACMHRGTLGTLGQAVFSFVERLSCVPHRVCTHYAYCHPFIQQALDLLKKFLIYNSKNRIQANAVS